MTNFGLRAVSQGAARQAGLRAEEERRDRDFREFKDLDKTLSIQFRLVRLSPFGLRDARQPKQQFFVCKLETVLAT